MRTHLPPSARPLNDHSTGLEESRLEQRPQLQVEPPLHLRPFHMKGALCSLRRCRRHGRVIGEARGSIEPPYLLARRVGLLEVTPCLLHALGECASQLAEVELVVPVRIPEVE